MATMQTYCPCKHLGATCSESALLHLRTRRRAGGTHCARRQLTTQLPSVASSTVAYPSARSLPTSLVPEPSQPSSDLQDLCTLQLGLLQHLLRQSAGKGHKLRAAVYVRSAGPGAVPGSVCLQRVATMNDSSAAQAGLGSVGQAGLLSPAGDLRSHGDVIMLQLGNEMLGAGQPAESFLLTEEMLILPSSGALVMPLVDSQALVGLLLVEPSTSATSQEPFSSLHDVELMSGLAKTRARHDGEHEPAVAHPDGHQLSNGSENGNGNDFTAWMPQAPGFTDEELHALRVTAPILAKACAMELRSALKSLAMSAQTTVANNLLREAQRPASALHTFSAMLLPRLDEGSADRDLVKGITLQGKRLQELLRQLEAVLLPRPATLPFTPTQRPVLQHAEASPQAATPANLHSSTQTQSPFAHATAAALVLDASPIPAQPINGAHTNAGPQPDTQHQPQQVLHINALDTHTPYRDHDQQQPRSQSDQGAEMHLGPAHMPTPSAPPAQPDGPTPSFSMSVGSVGAGSGVSVGVIDLERDHHHQQHPHHHQRQQQQQQASPGHRAVMAAKRRAQPQPKTAQTVSGASTDLVAALVNILTSAARLARVTGVYFSLQHPLRTAADSGKGSGKISGSQAGGPAPAARQSLPSRRLGAVGTAVQTHDDAPVLLPPPSRPLMVAVSTHHAQSIIAYVTDLALQCTPQGGTVCVSAAPVAGGWVECVVCHTGQLVVDRLHTRTPLLHPTLSAPTDALTPSDTVLSLARAKSQPQPQAVQGPGQAGGAASSTGFSARANGLPGSGLLSLGMAKELVERVGGQMTCHYPASVHSAVTGRMEQATRVVIRLPAL